MRNWVDTPGVGARHLQNLYFCQVLNYLFTGARPYLSRRIMWMLAGASIAGFGMNQELYSH